MANNPDDERARAVVEEFYARQSPVLPYFKRDALQDLIANALRDERRRMWECVLHEAMRHGLDSGMSFVQWLRHQAEAPHG